MSGLATLIGVLASGYAGYEEGKETKRRRDRRDQLDAREDEEYEYQKEKRDRSRQLETDISGAMADRDVETVASPDMSNADISMAGPQPTKYRVGTDEYEDEGAARLALQGVNSRAAKFQRAADVAATGGEEGMVRAQQYEAFAKRALDEGADKILTGVQRSAPTLDAVKKSGGVVKGTIGAELADVFNKTGSHWKVTGDAGVEHFIDKDAAGREFVNSRIIGKDGKPVVSDVANAGLLMADLKTRLEQRNKDTTTFQTGQQIQTQQGQLAETTRSNKAREAETSKDNAAGRAIQWGTLGLARAKDKREAELFKNQTIDGQLEQIEKAVGPMTDDDKKAYRKKLLGIGSNKNTDDALVGDLTKKWSENNPQATAGQVAEFRAGLQDAFTQVGNNRTVQAEVQAQFTKNPFGSAGYAQVYNDAKGQLGLTDQQLAAWGYKAPAEDKQRVASRTGVKQPSYRERQAAEAAQEKAERIATLTRNVNGLTPEEKAGRLTEYARRSLAEQRAELARLTAQ